MCRRVSNIIYSSGSWKFHFFTVAFLCAAVSGLPTADPNINMNVTISVPAGTSDHGDPNLLCTPTKRLDVLIFFLANYFAHAATVKALPGEKTMDLAFIVFLAITFPFSGVARGLEAIVRHASFYRGVHSDLQTAVRAGALCIVVRDRQWVPDLNLPIETIDSEAEPKSLPEEACFRIDISEGKNALEDVKFRKVHGLHRLPKGYRLALLPSNTKVIPNVTDNTGDRKKLIISSSYSVPQATVAIVQVLYASYTLYKTRGDQLNRYGYAAFGLTVIPYILMSFVNLIGNISTPDYQTLYLVSSPELKEAISRGGQIDGVVGKVDEDSWVTSEYRFAGQFKAQKDSRLLRRVHADPKEASSSQIRARSANILVTSSMTEQDTVSDRVVGLLCASPDDDPSIEFKILFPEFSPFKTIGQRYQGLRRSGFSGFLWWGFMVFFLGAIPYAVIGSLTHFQGAQSTQAQRVLTMFWLTSGVFIGATLPFYSFGFQEMIDVTKVTSISQKEMSEAALRVETAEDARYAMQKKLRESVARAKEIQAKTEEIEKIEERFMIERIKIEAEMKGVRDKMMEHGNRAMEAEEAYHALRGSITIVDRDKARVKVLLMFLGSLVFCAGAIGGFVVVGQMLRAYGSCISLS